MINVKEDYINYINNFVLKTQSAEDFADKYVDKYLEDKRSYDDNIFYILDELFVFAEGHTKNPALLEQKSPFCFNDAQLYEAAENALQKLRALK